MIDTVVAKLVEQLPSSAAIIVVVVYFIRYIQKRDDSEKDKTNKYLQVLSELLVGINTVVTKQDAHHSAMMDAVSDMRSTIRQRAHDAKSVTRPD